MGFGSQCWEYLDSICSEQTARITMEGRLLGKIKIDRGVWPLLHNLAMEVLATRSQGKGVKPGNVDG